MFNSSPWSFLILAERFDATEDAAWILFCRKIIKRELVSEKAEPEIVSFYEDQASLAADAIEKSNAMISEFIIKQDEWSVKKHFKELK